MKRAASAASPLCAALAAALASTACVPDPGRADRTRDDYLRLLVAEDARPTEGPELALLVASTRHPDPLVRRTAVRALGRFEDPAHRETIVAHLADPAASVRAAAATALAQSANGRDGEAVLAPLLERAPEENDPAARGALARALGRLRLTSASRASAVEAVLLLGRRFGSGPADEAPPPTLTGAALALAALLGADRDEGVGPEVAGRLEELLAYRRDDPADVDAARIRALAFTGLAGARRVTLELVLAALDDPDEEVRRAALSGLDYVVPSRRNELLRRALADRADPVAIEAVRYVAARTLSPPRCALLAAAAATTARTPVRVEALATLAAPCEGSDQAALLREAAASLDASGAWHTPVQALRSLARFDPTAAAALLPRFVEHPDPFVRAHAARVAATLQDRRALGALDLDESANVRTAAVEGLFALEGHGVDPLLRAHLVSDDPWLLLTAAGLLAGSPDREAGAEAALAAFERISEARRETWRDPRRALLEVVAELGGSPLAERLRPYLADYDPVVAADVAAILEAWTGETQEPTPLPLARAPLPSLQELDALERTTVTLHMRGLGPVVIRLHPEAAITNAARFARLTRAGYFDGLTFHRRASNFVIQGGSPGANEYAGDGPYTRDEIEWPHWRGTVGLSTRGRDTGDGQIFINLVHNMRLDADYTVFGEVVQGMDVVDRVLEGAVIERAEVRVEG